MGSIDSALVDAGEFGREEADAANFLFTGSALRPDTGVHFPGDDIGRLVLGAYRSRGRAALRSVIQAYQDGYNDRAQELGNGAVSWDEIKGGIGRALPGATDQEQMAIATAL